MKNRYDMVGDDAVPRNADLQFRLTWTYHGVAVDLTGHTLDFKLWRSDQPSVADPLILCDNAGAGGIVVPDVLLGQAYYTVAHAQIAGLPAAIYYYFARDTAPGGGITLLAHGRFETFGPTT